MPVMTLFSALWTSCRQDTLTKERNLTHFLNTLACIGKKMHANTFFVSVMIKNLHLLFTKVFKTITYSLQYNLQFCQNRKLLVWHFHPFILADCNVSCGIVCKHIRVSKASDKHRGDWNAITRDDLSDVRWCKTLRVKPNI